MANIDVILTEDFPALGYVGEKVQVRAGYARNFLIPRGKAVPGASRNARELAHRLQGIAAKRQRLKKEAEARASQLSSIVLPFTLKAGPGGKLFGSIQNKDIVTALAERGEVFDRNQVRILDAIKKAGSYKVQIRLHAEVFATIQIDLTVESDAPKVKAEEAEAGAAAEGAKKGRKRSAKKAESAEAAAPEQTEEKA